MDAAAARMYRPLWSGLLPRATADGRLSGRHSISIPSATSMSSSHNSARQHVAAWRWVLSVLSSMAASLASR